jgi:hypothetical protein
MYGLIGKMTAQQGQRDALQAILLETEGGMPGSTSYVVAQAHPAASLPFQAKPLRCVGPVKYGCGGGPRGGAFYST